MRVPPSSMHVDLNVGDNIKHQVITGLALCSPWWCDWQRGGCTADYPKNKSVNLSGP